jgi:hypothetical protein
MVMRELQVAVASTRRNSLIFVALLLICRNLFIGRCRAFCAAGSGLNLTEIVLEASARLISQETYVSTRSKIRR